MKLYIKQKVFSLTSKFSVKDERGEDKYFVRGEFFSLKGRMYILDAAEREVGQIYSRIFTLLPRFILEIGGTEVAEIVKEFTLFRQRYRIENSSLRIEGDVWAHEYTLFDSDREVMRIHKEWLSWGDTYELDIADPSYELISLGVVLAIDAAMANAAASS